MDSQAGQHFRGQVGLKPPLNFLPVRIACLRSRPLDSYRSKAAAPTHSLLSCQVWPASQEEGQTANKSVPSSSCVNNLVLDRSSRHAHTSSFLAKHQGSLSTQGDNDTTTAFGAKNHSSCFNLVLAGHHLGLSLVYAEYVCGGQKCLRNISSGWSCIQHRCHSSSPGSSKCMECCPNANLKHPDHYPSPFNVIHRSLG